jgi:hypothetical protein
MRARNIPAGTSPVDTLGNDLIETPPWKRINRAESETYIASMTLELYEQMPHDALRYDRHVLFVQYIVFITFIGV